MATQQQNDETGSVASGLLKILVIVGFLGSFYGIYRHFAKQRELDNAAAVEASKLEERDWTAREIRNADEWWNIESGPLAGYVAVVKHSRDDSFNVSIVDRQNDLMKSFHYDTSVGWNSGRKVGDLQPETVALLNEIYAKQINVLQLKAQAVTEFRSKLNLDEHDYLN